MSKLATLLRRAARSEPAPMGFTALAGRKKNPEMLISVNLSTLDPEAAVAAARGGASSIILSGGDLDRDADRIKALTEAVEAPCGLRLSTPAAGATEAARALGLDFLRIEDDDTPAATLLDEEMGFVLTVSGEATDTFLRTLESMPFDALFAGQVSQPFTIRRQLELRRLAGFSHKPLLLQVDDVLNSEDLECLRDSGVASILLDGGDGLAERLAAQHQAIEAMRPRSRRRTERERETAAVLPAVHAAHGDEEDDDE